MKELKIFFAVIDQMQEGLYFCTICFNNDYQITYSVNFCFVAVRCISWERLNLTVRSFGCLSALLNQGLL